MLNLAIVVLVVLVASTLWLLLRPPLPVAQPRASDVPDAPDAVDTVDTAEPPGPPAVRATDPHHADARALRH